MTSPSPTLTACSKVLQIAPPSESKQTFQVLKDLLSSNPDALEELSTKLIQVPLETAVDKAADNRPFLLCEFNKQGESFRSPWSNTFYPPLADADESILPAGSLRTLELHANQVWDTYRELYYGEEHSVGSVYLQEQDEKAFIGCFLIQKDVDKGQWSSVHVVQAGNDSPTNAKYQIHSTIHMTMAPESQTTLGARLTKETNETCKFSETNANASHLENIGKLIESVEMELRSSMEGLHIPKTREAIETLRQESRPQRGGMMGMMGMMAGNGDHIAILNQAVLARAALKKTSK